MPAVAIAMAVHRPHPRYFREQLASIQAQTFRDWVCIMCWDSPIEEMAGVLAEAQVMSDRRFIIVQNPARLGHKKNFEKAIRAAVELDVRAIACSDQDDVWLPPKLQVLWDALENMPDMSLVHSDMRIIHSRPDSDEDTLAKETAWTLERRNPANVDPAFMLLRNNVSGCSMLMHATLARNYPIVPDAFAFHDHWFAVAAAHHGGIGHTRSALLLHRQHGGNTVGARRAPTVAHRIRQVGVRQVIRNMLAAHGAYLSRIEACRSQGLSPMGQISKHHDRTFRIPFILTLCAYSLRHAYSDPFLAKEALKVAIGTLVK